MTHFDPDQYAALFFHFGAVGESASGETPLVCLNGGIMADTGSEALSYIYTCQDRYPVYAALGRMRCLLFVRDDDDVPRYEAGLDSVKSHLRTIQEVTGFSLVDDFPEPLYMPCDVYALDSPFCPGRKFLLQVDDPRFVNSHVLGGVYLNQLSPTIAALLGQFYGFLKGQGHKLGARLEEYSRMAQHALEWHDKSKYVELLRENGGAGPLPKHVPSALFSSRLLEEMTWARLVELVQSQTGGADAKEYFVKSAMDACGEVNMIVDRANFAFKTKELTEEIAVKVTEMDRTQSEVQLLVQPRIERCAGQDGQSDGRIDLPSSVGITYNIHDTERFERLVVAGHVYEDPERKSFIGCYLCESLTRHFLETVGEEKILSLLRLFAAKGYRGPINLDAVRDRRGQYVFIYDCNPRMGGSLPGVLLKLALERSGLDARTILTLGYHGRIIYPDLRAKLDELNHLDLLYTRSRQRGVYIIPSLVRPDSFDLVLVNMAMGEATDFVDSGLVDALSKQGRRDLKGLYL